MYSVFLTLHSLTRWVVVVLGVIVVVRAFLGIAGKRGWVDADSRFVRFFILSMNIQFVLGLVLYIFLSPAVQRAMTDFGAAMRDGVIRFWFVEHMTMMIIALALVHVGGARVRRAAEAIGKHRNAAIFFTLALVAIFLAIPWPGMGADPRPLFRFSF
ncbi:MAG TPA: hypothetical protein PKC19_06275 [Roseiflexaceae bacterium]|nr:hypothetical protein [Roseiflexaceae bacterium]